VATEENSPLRSALPSQPLYTTKGTDDGQLVTHIRRQQPSPK
jgi:hypothetical protein